MPTDQYDPKISEKKWNKKWEESALYTTDLDDTSKPKFYNLIMFPYPSGAALHVGHVYCYGGADTYARFKRMQGYNVFEPMGFDAFGIHAENYAMKIGEHPQVVVPRNVEHFREQQMKKLGAMFDWSQEVNTTDPSYYKWTQWIFIQMFKAGLAQRRVGFVDWCPGCKTVLANEQVINGICERCDSTVEQKELPQWFFKITDYAERLLQNLDQLDWPKRTKTLQHNWIGKKVGIDIQYKIENTDHVVTCFTTRPETNYGATFVVLSPEHPLVDKISTPEQRLAIENYRKEIALKSELERTDLNKDKTGVFTGAYCINDLNGQRMPIWIGDFVLMHFGTGAVVAVPGHDIRDFEFAQKFNLPISRVLSLAGEDHSITKPEDVFEDAGVVVNSADFLDGTGWQTARELIMDYMEKHGWGKRTTSYRLHDWCISRQRYWGPPIPMIHCQQCGWNPVKEEDLPIILPELANYQPDGTGKGPLASVADFVHTSCPVCEGPAERETDVSDTFLDSAWYQLRYPCAHRDDAPFDQERTKNWLPVDMYIGGIEHATMHLLYIRFISMALFDLGYLPFEEPTPKLRHQGLIIKDGAKMSKSRGNVVNPDEYIQKYGADAFRTYMLFIGPYEDGGDFNDRGILGASRFFDKIWDTLLSEHLPGEGVANMAKFHATIKKTTEDIENLSFNTAIASLMELINWIKEERSLFSREQFSTIQSVLPRLIAPFAPFFAEELWEKLGNSFSIHNQPWPEFDVAQLEEDTCIFVFQINGKVRDKIEVKKHLNEDQLRQLAQENERIQKWIAGKTIKKIIIVPDKLINIVVD